MRFSDDREQVDGQRAVDDLCVVGIAAQECHELGVQKGQARIQAALDLVVRQQVVGCLGDSFLDRLGQRNREPIESVGQQVLEALLDREPYDDLVGKLGADPIDDHRIVGDIGDHADKSVGRQNRLVEPCGHRRGDENETGEHAEEDREEVVDAVMLFHLSTCAGPGVVTSIPASYAYAIALCLSVTRLCPAALHQSDWSLP